MQIFCIRVCVQEISDWLSQLCVCVQMIRNLFFPFSSDIHQGYDTFYRCKFNLGAKSFTGKAFINASTFCAERNSIRFRCCRVFGVPTFMFNIAFNGIQILRIRAHIIHCSLPFSLFRTVLHLSTSSLCFKINSKPIHPIAFANTYCGQPLRHPRLPLSPSHTQFIF